MLQRTWRNHNSSKYIQYIEWLLAVMDILFRTLHRGRFFSGWVNKSICIISEKVKAIISLQHYFFFFLPREVLVARTRGTTVPDEVMKMMNLSKADHSNQSYLLSFVKKSGLDMWTFSSTQKGDGYQEEKCWSVRRNWGKKCLLFHSSEASLFLDYWLMKPGAKLSYIVDFFFFLFVR